MPPWEERVQNHPTLAELATLVTALEAAEAMLDGVQVVEAHARLQNVADYSLHAFAHADAELVSPGVLERVHGHVQLVRQQVEAFVQDSDVDHLLRANENADAWLDEIGSFPLPREAADASGTLSTFRRSSAQYLHNFEDKTTELAQQLETRLNEATDQIDPLSVSLTELKDEIDGQKGRIDAAVRDTQDRYLAEKQERDTVFGAALEEQRGQAEQARTESETLFSQERERLKTATDEALAQLEGQKARAREIVGLLGNTGLTGHYQKIANREMWAAYGWISIALAAFALAVLTHLFFPGWDLKAATSWDDVLPKVVVSIPLILFGLFAINESRMHRGREQFNRDMELQLASVDPYLESIPEKAADIKDRMFERFFPGRAQRRLPDDEDTSSP